MQRLLILLLQTYRYWLSPWLGNQCRFHPSCSCYAIEAIQHHGAMKGLMLTGKRLLRCQPWCLGGYDPVPPRSVRTVPWGG